MKQPSFSVAIVRPYMLVPYICLRKISYFINRDSKSKLFEDSGKTGTTAVLLLLLPYAVILLKQHYCSLSFTMNPSGTRSFLYKLITTHVP